MLTRSAMCKPSAPDPRSSTGQQQCLVMCSHTLDRLETIPGVGRILGLTLLYEIHDIARFSTVQRFSSYCRLAKPEHRSAGKRVGSGGAKIGNAHLKWAFSETAGLISGRPGLGLLPDHLGPLLLLPSLTATGSCPVGS